jgi:hypothetical protein
MLTLIGVPKPCEGVFHTIQQNAIRSWTLLGSDCEVILLGNEHGVAALSADLGVRHIPVIERNELGTPLLSSILLTGSREASNDFVALVNSDIILMSDFYEAFRRLWSLEKWFLMVGQRRNIDFTEPICFDAHWQHRVRQLAISAGDLWGGIDYFLFPRSLWIDVPPFAIGRLHWDNWPLYAARLRRARVVDTTPAVLAIHQNHPYSSGALGGDESRVNRDLLGGARIFTMSETTHILKMDGLYPRCKSCDPVCCCTF